MPAPAAPLGGVVTDENDNDTDRELADPRLLPRDDELADPRLLPPPLPLRYARSRSLCCPMVGAADDHSVNGLDPDAAAHQRVVEREQRDR